MTSNVADLILLERGEILRKGVMVRVRSGLPLSSDFNMVGVVGNS